MFASAEKRQAGGWYGVMVLRFCAAGGESLAAKLSMERVDVMVSGGTSGAGVGRWADVDVRFTSQC
jgi:hypothetical protein